MKQSEFKKRYDPELGRFTRQHIYGEGVMDVFKNIGSKVFNQTLKKAAKTAATKAITTAATKTGEHVGEKAGDKIIEFLSRKKKTSKNYPKNVTFSLPSASLSQQDRYQQLGRILSDD